MAAHLEGRGASTLDITGLAQKGGAVISHIRLSGDARSSGAVRIDARQADVAILCDAVSASRPDIVATLRPGETQAIVNTYLAPTAEFTHDPDVDLNPSGLIADISRLAGVSNTRSFNAHELAQSLVGDAIMSNKIGRAECRERVCHDV